MPYLALKIISKWEDRRVRIRNTRKFCANPIVRDSGKIQRKYIRSRTNIWESIDSVPV